MAQIWGGWSTHPQEAASTSQPRARGRWRKLSHSLRGHCCGFPAVVSTQDGHFTPRCQQASWERIGRIQFLWQGLGPLVLLLAVLFSASRVYHVHGPPHTFNVSPGPSPYHYWSLTDTVTRTIPISNPHLSHICQVRDQAQGPESGSSTPQPFWSTHCWLTAAVMLPLPWALCLSGCETTGTTDQ